MFSRGRETHAISRSSLVNGGMLVVARPVAMLGASRVGGTLTDVDVRRGGGGSERRGPAWPLLGDRDGSRVKPSICSIRSK